MASFIRLFVVALFVLTALGYAHAQRTPTENPIVIEGTVRDPQGHPLVDVRLSLESVVTGHVFVCSTDAQGHYRLAVPDRGNYRLRARLAGWRDAQKGPFAVGENHIAPVDFILERDGVSEKTSNEARPVEFSDEPAFTVAGVTDPTNLGGHGSDVAMRTKESLARETVSLGRRNIEEEKKRVAVLRMHSDSAELHKLLGDIAESEGQPLQAVREYQRAAEMEPSEANLFAWGAELLLHRAFEPAAEVFTRGHTQFPRSTRMLVGLGVTSYARGNSEEAAQQLAAACDLEPADATPYLFLGKLQNAEKIEPAGWTERLKRFAGLRPENALAHYYYAVALTKEPQRAGRSEQIVISLLKAIQLNPRLGEAYLQLGIAYAGQKDFAKAIAAYQKAIENTALPDQAHFRLAEAYRLTGERAKAREQIELYNQISQQRAQESERERHEIGQFVYTLKDKTELSPTPAVEPKHR